MPRVGNAATNVQAVARRAASAWPGCRPRNEQVRGQRWDRDGDPNGRIGALEAVTSPDAGLFVTADLLWLAWNAQRSGPPISSVQANRDGGRKVDGDDMSCSALCQGANTPSGHLHLASPRPQGRS